MTIRILPNGTIEVENELDFAVVMKWRNAETRNVSATAENKDRPSIPPTQGKTQPLHDYSSFLKKLRGTQAEQFLIQMFEKPGVSDDEVKVKFGLKDNYKLGGFLLGLSHKAKSSGFTRDDIYCIDLKIDKVTHKRSYTYKLTNGMLAALKERTPLLV